MIRTFRYPLRPTKAQEIELEKILWACQGLYNGALQERRDSYKRFGRSLSYADQTKSLTEIRSELSEFGAVGVGPLRSALKRLDRAFQSFFRRVKNGEKPGYPRFKSRDRYNSFSMMNDVRIDGNRIRVPKLGEIKFHKYRELKGIPLDASIRREGDRWFLSVQCDLGRAPEKVEPKTFTGIDVGLTTFATLSNGEEIANPRFFRSTEELLADRQRKLETKKRGSRSRHTAKALVAKAHAKIKNQRVDHARKLAKSLFSRFDLIAYENLNIKGMVGGNLSKSIHDVSWGQFISCLISKAEEAGKLAIGVDPRGTSQRCSGCDQVVKKTLPQRDHLCSHCGLSLGRDHNAAINIHRLGLSLVKGPEMASAEAFEVK